MHGCLNNFNVSDCSGFVLHQKLHLLPGILEMQYVWKVERLRFAARLKDHQLPHIHGTSKMNQPMIWYHAQVPQAREWESLLRNGNITRDFSDRYLGVKNGNENISEFLTPSPCLNLIWCVRNSSEF